DERNRQAPPTGNDRDRNLSAAFKRLDGETGDVGRNWSERDAGRAEDEGGAETAPGNARGSGGGDSRPRGRRARPEIDPWFERRNLPDRLVIWFLQRTDVPPEGMFARVRRRERRGAGRDGYSQQTQSGYERGPDDGLFSRGCGKERGNDHHPSRRHQCRIGVERRDKRESPEHRGGEAEKIDGIPKPHRRGHRKNDNRCGPPHGDVVGACHEEERSGRKEWQCPKVSRGGCEARRRGTKGEREW